MFLEIFTKKGNLKVVFPFFLLTLLFSLMTWPSLAEVPHNNYFDDTSSCSECHIIHESGLTGGALLKGISTKTYTSLGDVVYDTCDLCHGAGGSANFKPYEAIGSMQARHTPTLVLTSNSTLYIPTPEAGVSEVRKVLCAACHNPHGTPQYTVATYTSDLTQVTNALLRRVGSAEVYALPGAGTMSYNFYGSLWCADCHLNTPQGMDNGHHYYATWTTYNATVSYQKVWAWDAGASQYTSMSMGTTNAAYVLLDQDQLTIEGPVNAPWPICQQCHEDARRVILTSPLNQLPFSVGSNPTYTYFPHQAENPGFRIELGDSLCADQCHPVEELP